MDFEHTLQLAREKCDGKFVEQLARKFYILYPFTTENIGGYIKEFRLKDKSLLTVGSSFDQVLNATLYDCKDITLLDTCPFMKYYAYLKIASLLELDRNGFFRFLRYKNYPKTFKDNPLLFNKEDYQKVFKTLRFLDYESYLFWDELFQNYDSKTIRNEIFYSGEEDKQKVIETINPYLRIDYNYEETKKKIKKVKLEFIQADLFQVKLNRSYDSIWLSNIGTHLMHHDKIMKMIEKMSIYLNENGKMLMSYLYDTDESYRTGYYPIYNFHVTLENLKEYNPELISFIGMHSIIFNDDRTSDSILVYEKKK